MIAALYIRKDSIYKQLGCDCWDIERDARNWPGGSQIIAHPPCRAWGRFRQWANPREGEKQLAISAVGLIRKWGGVLEHPAGSSLWAEMRLPKPGCGFDAFGGWSLAVWQSWFGHRAQKKTWLYVVGCDPKDIPPYPLSLNAITHVINIDSGTPKALRRPEVSKKEREATPVEFAKWLIKLAGLCNHSKHF